MSSKVEKKTWKMSESGGFFQVLTHDNYELTNDSQLYFFYTSTMLGILQQTKLLSIIHFKDHNFEFKVKKPWKILGFSQILKVKFE